MAYDEPKVRVEQFEEAVQVLQGLLSERRGRSRSPGATTRSVTTASDPGPSRSRARR